MRNKLNEGSDFYYTDEGYIVFTFAYHLERGYCCGNGCRHCPFSYKNVNDIKRNELTGFSSDFAEAIEDFKII